MNPLTRFTFGLLYLFIAFIGFVTFPFPIYLYIMIFSSVGLALLGVGYVRSLNK